MEAPVTKPADIHTFETPPSEEIASAFLARLVKEVELSAQQMLTEQLARLPGVRVVPFADARRMTEDARAPGQRLTDEQLRAFGLDAGADLVLSVILDDYGRLQWDHWAFGWLSVASTHTAIVGAATAWNPLAMGAYLAWDLTTDFPLWYGGAYFMGWAFRPVHVIVDATQLKGCEMPIWTEEEIVIIAGKKALAAFPEEQRKRKEVQLRVNLERALQKVVELAGKTLRLKPCPEAAKAEAGRG